VHVPGNASRTSEITCHAFIYKSPHSAGPAEERVGKKAWRRAEGSTAGQRGRCNCSLCGCVVQGGKQKKPGLYGDGKGKDGNTIWVREQGGSNQRSQYSSAVVLRNTQVTPCEMHHTGEGWGREKNELTGDGKDGREKDEGGSGSYYSRKTWSKISSREITETISSWIAERACAVRDG